MPDLSVKIAFYAPMKSPRHRIPSGDRRLARLFLAVLRRAGYTPQLASELRSWEGGGDARRQAQLRRQADNIADRLIRRYRDLPAAHRPRAWFTYHLYHKAPDWLGPCVCTALGIPYVLAEASVADKQRHGPWHRGYRQSQRAIQQAGLIFMLNQRDQPGVRAVAGAGTDLVTLPPFLDLPGLPVDRRQARRQLALPPGLERRGCWLLCVAMMRPGAKFTSYSILAAAVRQLRDRNWHLLVVGDGPAKAQVQALFRRDAARVHFLGQQPAAAVYQLMHAADLLVWPAVNEAIGMVALEALACGLPALVGDAGGIGQIVRDDITGRRLPLDAVAARRFATEIDRLLADPGTLARLAANCVHQYRTHHRLQTASRTVADALHRTLAARRTTDG